MSAATMVRASDLWVITGNQAAGKSTVGRLLAERFPVAAHIEGDDMQNLLVSGKRWPTPEDIDPADGSLVGMADVQYRLRIRNACLVGRSCAEAGIVGVVTDIICGAGFDVARETLAGCAVHFVALRPSVEVLRARERERLSPDRRREAELRGGLINDFEAGIEADLDRLPPIGLRVDNSTITPMATVQAILDGRDASLVDL